LIYEKLVNMQQNLEQLHLMLANWLWTNLK
jgi:hypothetical protein